MARLVQPQETVTQISAGISAGAAAAPGIAEAQTGDAVQRLGKQYFQEARRADQIISYSNAMTKATSEYTERATQRMSTAADEEGNPTYSTMVDDVGAIGEDIKRSIVPTLVDPDVRARFESEFRRFDVNQRMQAFSAARKQQMSFGRESLSENLRTREQAAIGSNPEQLGFYEDQTRKELDTALAAGLISPEERDRFTESFRKTVRVEAFRSQIRQDPEATLETLQTSEPQDLGITEQERARLSLEARAEIEDQERIRRREEQEAEKARQDKILQTVHSFQVAYAEQEAGLVASGPSLADLVAVQEEIGDANYVKLIGTHIRVNREDTREEVALGKLSEAIANGEDLGDFSTKIVNKHLRRAVEAFEEEKGGDATLQEIAGIASVYNRPIRSLSEQVSESILHGPPERAQDALNAYISNRNHRAKALGGSAFDREAEDIAEYAELLIDSGGIPALEAMELSRQTVMNKDFPTMSERRKEFRKFKEFTPNRIQRTMNSQMGLRSTLLRRQADVGLDVQNTYRNFAQEAYVRTGNKKAAMKIANMRLEQTHGISRVGGKRRLMLAPPEEEFPGLSAKEMTAQLHDDVADILPPGINAEDVNIVSDENTKGSFIVFEDGSTRELVTYNVTYNQELDDGSTIELPLLDPLTGEPQVWFPNIEPAFERFAEKQQRTVQKAREERELGLRLREERRPFSELLSEALAGEEIGTRRRRPAEEIEEPPPPSSTALLSLLTKSIVSKEPLNAEATRQQISESLPSIQQNRNDPEFRSTFLSLWNPINRGEEMNNQEQELYQALAVTGDPISAEQAKVIVDVMQKDPMRFEALV